MSDVTNFVLKFVDNDIHLCLQEQRKAENEGVTEDDVNEIKNDISAFRFEMIEIMRASGMNTQSATGPSG